jgi:hypothetical protein
VVACIVQEAPNHSEGSSILPKVSEHLRHMRSVKFLVWKKNFNVTSRFCWRDNCGGCQILGIRVGNGIIEGARPCTARTLFPFLLLGGSLRYGSLFGLLRRGFFLLLLVAAFEEAPSTCV